MSCLLGGAFPLAAVPVPDYSGGPAAVVISAPSSPTAASYRASDILGMEAQDRFGQNVGRISDVVYDMRTGRISFGVITTLEDDRKIAVPASLLVAQPGAGAMTLACDTQHFRAAVDFKKTDVSDPQWAAMTLAYYGVTQPVVPPEQWQPRVAAVSPPLVVEPAGVAAPAVSAPDHDAEIGRITAHYQRGKGQARQMDERYWNNASPDTSYVEAATPVVVAPDVTATAPVVSPVAPPTAVYARSSDLIGMPVRDAMGKRVGAIKDVVMDWTTGRMLFAVLDPRGISGARDRYIAIIPGALTRSDAGGYLIANVPKDFLANAPSFDRTQWPGPADQEFVTAVYNYYSHP